MFICSQSGDAGSNQMSYLTISLSPQRAPWKK